MVYYYYYFVFCQLNFIVLFPFLIKYCHILFIRPSGLLLFVSAVLFSILMPLFCVSSSVSLSYFILSVLMRKCLGKHSCMSSSFPIVILNDTSFFPTVQLQVHNENPARYRRNTNALVNLNTKLNSFTLLFLPSSSVSLSYFILAVLMRNCLGIHSCLSCTFPVTILKGTYFFGETM